MKPHALMLALATLCSVYDLTMSSGHCNHSFYIIPTEQPLLKQLQMCHSSVCFTLNEISDNYQFENDTTLWMLVGTHSIEGLNTSTLQVENVRNFAIFGGIVTIIGPGESQKSSNTIIQCVGMFAFVFRNVTNLTIADVSIRFCGKADILSINLDATMLIIDSKNVSIRWLAISHGQGFGLIAKDFENILVSNSFFTNNTFNCMLDTRETQTPPYVSISNSQFSDNEGFELSQNQLQSGLQITIILEKLTFTLQLVNISLYNNYGMYLNLRSSYQKFNIDSLIRPPWLISQCWSDANYWFVHAPSILPYLNSWQFSICKDVFSPKFTLVKIHNITSTDTKLPLYRNYSVYALWLMLEPDIENYNHYSIFITDSYFKTGGCVYISTSYGERETYVYLARLSFQHLFCTHGALHLDNIHTTIIKYSTFSECGDSLVATHCPNITLEGECVFNTNKGGMRIEESVLTFNHSKEIKFADNFCPRHSPDCSGLIAKKSRIIVSNSYNIVFINNTGSLSGGITLVESTVRITNGTSMFFKDNTGSYGGALSFYRDSYFELCTPCNNPMECEKAKSLQSPVINLEFVGNHASEYGGAIFVKDSNYIDPTIGKLEKQVLFLDCRCARYVEGQFNFVNNTANIAGSAVFGGWIDANINTVPTTQDDSSVMSSNPIRVCLCVKSKPNCNITEYPIEVYPGHSFTIEAVTVGQRFGIVPGVVHAEFDNNRVDESSHNQIGIDEYTQTVGKYCTVLHYTVFSNELAVILVLTTQSLDVPKLDLITRNDNRSTCYLDHKTNISESLTTNPILFANFDMMISLLKQKPALKIHTKDCPLGFSLSATLHKCDCEQILIEHQITNCDINTLTILKPSQKWISSTADKAGIIVHDHCPFDYCLQITSLKEVSIDLLNPDLQCAFNRSGTLCGACTTNFSHVLGSSKCKECNNLWILLIIPAFALAGIALVIFLMLLNMTVAVGTINGLIFYANIVRANHTTFLPSNTFLSTFIAWLNLDLGIEVCLFSGLDAYVKTWLQFLFPLYIWLLVVTIIITSRYSSTASRLCGNNAVQVLATLFLLSYAKLLCVIITVLQPTTLFFRNNNQEHVWLYDGNISYLKGKHIPLFIVALVLLVILSIPYTSSLFFIQWLRKYNHFRLLFWVHKFKPLFDAHTGPYKDNHGYWTGWLLIIRVILFVIFSLNVSGDASVNLLAIGIIVSTMLAYLSLIGGVYKSQLANVIEMSFLLNIVVLTLVTLFNDSTPLMEFSNTSTATAFITFVLITLYHAYQRMISIEKGSQLKQYIKPIFKAKTEIANKALAIITQPVHTQPPASRSTIELRESLLMDVEHNYHKQL